MPEKFVPRKGFIPIVVVDSGPIEHAAVCAVRPDYRPFDQILKFLARDPSVLGNRTRGLVGKSELSLMKPSARLVNTSRGPVVDEATLVEVLRKRHIAGAAIDVFDVEPLPQSHPLRQLDNVVTTPHIGYVSRDLYRVFYQDTVTNIAEWLQRRPRL